MRWLLPDRDIAFSIFRNGFIVFANLRVDLSQTFMAMGKVRVNVPI